MIEDNFKFDKETLKIQSVARNEMRRKINITLTIFGISFLSLLVLSRIFPSTGGFAVLLFLPLLFVNNWIQWRTLISHELKCPHCGQTLAKRANILVSPSPKCRHCGKVALASIQELIQYAQSEKG
ncbi:MAG: hypothetical protein JNM55_10565 [Anaerolineales bacterium]|nr:hypothetical protein [Anaerolineales bacterium]